MNWATMQAGLLAWFAAALGVDDEAVQIPAAWEDEPEQMTPSGLLGLLKIRGIEAVGTDELRFVLDAEQPAGQDLIPQSSGNRRLTVSLSVEAHDLQPAWSAHRFLDRVRSKLRLPATQDALRELGLGILRTEAIQVVDGEVDGRRLGKAVLDVHFSYASNYLDTDGGTSFIETIGLSTELEDTGGTELPVPPNLLDETVPS